MGSGVDTCFPGVGELKSSNVMAPETSPGPVELPWDTTRCPEHPDATQPCDRRGRDCSLSRWGNDAERNCDSTTVTER